MFSRIMIGARDLKMMVAFYDAVLAILDLRRVVELNDVDEAGVVWRKGDQLAAVRPPVSRSIVCQRPGQRRAN